MAGVPAGLPPTLPLHRVVVPIRPSLKVSTPSAERVEGLPVLTEGSVVFRVREPLAVLVEI